MKIIPLSWDSSFFGFKIGKVSLEKATRADVEGIYTDVKKNKFRLVYIESDSRLPKTSSDKGSIKLVDVKTTLQTDTVHQTLHNSDWNIIEYNSPGITKELEALACESGLYSRFRIDPMFPYALYKKLYKRWLVNSVNKKMADVVFVCLNSTQTPIGLITVKKDKAYGHIGLVAVDEKYRHKYIGSSLLQEAALWNHSKGGRYLSVTTQYDNAAAMSLYRKFGFVITHKKYYYHYWIS